MTGKEEVTEAMLNPEEVFGAEMCCHCPNNPNAKKPFDKMVKVGATTLSDKIAQKLAKDTGLEEGCIYCFCVRKFFEKSQEDQKKSLASLGREMNIDKK